MKLFNNIRRSVVLIFVLFVLNQCTTLSQNGSYTFIPKKKITKSQILGFMKDSITNEYDNVLAIYKMEVPKFKDPSFLKIDFSYILTNDKLIEYHNVGGSITKNIVLIDKILKINQDTNLTITVFENTHYICELKEEHLFTSEMTINGDFNINDGKKFYSLLRDVWSENYSYDYLKMVYNHFYDENGDKKLTPSDSLEIEKMKELEVVLSEFKEIEFEKKSHTYFQLDKNPLIKISFNIFNSKYNIEGVELDTLPEDRTSRLMALIMYPVRVKDKYELPYQYNELKYLNAFELEFESAEKVLEELRVKLE